MSTPEPLIPHDLVLIGAVAAAHGLQGAVRVEPLTDFPERFLSLKSCFLRLGEQNPCLLQIKRCRIAANGILLVFSDIRTREQAGALRGATLEIPFSERMILPEDSYYVSDLLGCEALDEQGKSIGTICDILRGAQDILTISTRVGEIMVPFVNAWVGDVDLRQRTVVIRRFAELVSTEEIPPAVGERDL